MGRRGTLSISHSHSEPMNARLAVHVKAVVSVEEDGFLLVSSAGAFSPLFEDSPSLRSRSFLLLSA